MSPDSEQTHRVDVQLRPSIWRRANASQRRDLKLIVHELSTTSEFKLAHGLDDEMEWGIRLGLGPEAFIVTLVDRDGRTLRILPIPLGPLRSLICDYLSIIRRMGDAIGAHGMTHLEALDMARRSAHNEASERIREALQDVLLVDAETARRLFTVLCLVYDTPAR